MSRANYRGLLAIGDPHLASRVPGFRKDEYPKVILRKLDWCLTYARQHYLLPCLLGDVFHWPRDNANWLLGALLDLIQQDVLAISGNHDCAENVLTDDDSLSVIAKSGRIHLVDKVGPWQGTMNGWFVTVGGTSWGQKAPTSVRAVSSGYRASLTFWLMHDDICFHGYDAGRIEPAEIPGVDVVINGHIHRPLDEIVTGRTTWLNPGNIARVKRSDSTRECVPSVLRIDVLEDDTAEGGPVRDLFSHCDEPPAPNRQSSGGSRRHWRSQRVVVPHESFEQVFHADVVAEPVATESAFVQGLAELVARRTECGAGLREFLDQNLNQFDERVAQEILNLANEVLENAHP